MIVLARFVRDRTRATAWWSLGVVGLVLFTVAFYPSVKGQESFAEVFEDLPEAVRGLIGSIEGIPITSAPGYLQARMFGSLLPLLMLIFAIGLGARAIGGSEDDGTLELLLSNPVTRLRVAAERYAAMLILVAVLGVVATAALLLSGPPFGVLEGIGIGNLVLSTVAVVCLATFYGSVAFGVGCVTGRRAPALAVATALAVAGYLLQGLAAVSDAAHSLRVVSPWHWYLGRNILVSGPTAVAYVVPLAVSAIIVAVGSWRFLRRDLK